MDRQLLIQIKTVLESQGIDAARTKLDDLIKSQEASAGAQTKMAGSAGDAQRQLGGMRTMMDGVAASTRGGTAALDGMGRAAMGAFALFRNAAQAIGPVLGVITAAVAGVKVGLQAQVALWDRIVGSVKDLGGPAARSAADLQKISELKFGAAVQELDKLRAATDQLAQATDRQITELRRRQEDEKEIAIAKLALAEPDKAARAAAARTETQRRDVANLYEELDVRGKRRVAFEAEAAAAEDIARKQQDAYKRAVEDQEALYAKAARGERVAPTVAADVRTRVGIERESADAKQQAAVAARARADAEAAEIESLVRRKKAQSIRIEAEKQDEAIVAAQKRGSKYTKGEEDWEEMRRAEWEFQQREAANEGERKKKTAAEYLRGQIEIETGEAASARRASEAYVPRRGARSRRTDESLEQTARAEEADVSRLQGVLAQVMQGNQAAIAQVIAHLEKNGEQIRLLQDRVKRLPP